LRCLIDTGSTTTLLNKNKLHGYKRTKLKNKIRFSTLNSFTTVYQEITTELPKEFKEDNLMV